MKEIERCLAVAEKLLSDLIDDHNEDEAIISDFLKEVKNLLEHKMRPVPIAFGSSMFASVQDRVWQFIEETLIKSNAAGARELVETVKNTDHRNAEINEARSFNLDLKSTTVQPPLVQATAFAGNALGMGLQTLATAKESLNSFSGFSWNSVSRNAIPQAQAKVGSTPPSTIPPQNEALAAKLIEGSNGGNNANKTCMTCESLQQELNMTKDALNTEKQSRLSLQVELVSVKHARDIDIAGLKSQNPTLQRMNNELRNQLESLKAARTNA
ncbi:hypothetical protein HDU76_006847 [Blyttiomyces sp. JEL0837]|nr:hypothetical protein HDU76_006847 [Blyttiomyces sp. JEL0837]